MNPNLEEKEFVDKIDITIWQKILKHMRPYKKQAALLMLTMLMVSVLDLAAPLMGTYAIDHIIATDRYDRLTGFGAVFLAGAVAQGCLVMLFIYLAGWLEAHVSRDIRREAFQHTHELSFSYHDQTPVGYLMARLTSDITRLGETIGWGIVDISWSIAIIIGYFTTMLILNWRLALIVLAVLPPLIVVSTIFQRKILKQQRLVRKTNSNITRSFNEGIMGAKTSKTLVREDLNFQEFSQLTETMRRASIRSQVFSALFWPFVMTLGSVATGIVLWQGGYMNLQQLLKLGELSAFISYTGHVFDPITNLARMFAELQGAQASAERVVALLDTPLKISDPPQVVAEYGTLFDPKRENWPEIHGDVVFENVNFSYNSNEEVLKDFSLTVKAGQTIALVGETGSGKSTIVNLLCRFYEPVSGNIYIDGTEYRDRSQLWLQSHLGYVLQAPHLFSGTIRDNIRYGHMEATDEQVRWAAKLVSAEQFILKLPDGYDTDVGEGGNRLSTGEKQLISFARAVLTNPRLFVLDEATSSIDTETEQLIQNAIQTVLKGRTSFIIAHRLSTIRKADQILVIRGGCVVEQGNHRQLMKQRGYYYDLYTNQFKEEQQRSLVDSAANVS